MVQVFCRYCGTQLKDGAGFCHSCGNPIVQIQTDSSETSTAAAAVAPNSAANAAEPATLQNMNTTISNSGSLRIAPAFESFILEDLPPDTTTDVLETIATSGGKRSAIFITCSGSVKDAYEKAIQIVSNDKYSLKAHNNEMVWKKGVGLATAMHFITLTPMKNHLYVQGWVMGGVGDLEILEHPLTGFVGAIPKKSVKDTISVIQAICGGASF